MADIEVTLNHSENYSSSTAKTYRGYVINLCDDSPVDDGTWAVTSNSYTGYKINSNKIDVWNINTTSSDKSVTFTWTSSKVDGCTKTLKVTVPGAVVTLKSGNTEMVVTTKYNTLNGGPFDIYPYMDEFLVNGSSEGIVTISNTVGAAPVITCNGDMSEYWINYTQNNTDNKIHVSVNPDMSTYFVGCTGDYIAKGTNTINFKYYEREMSVSFPVIFKFIHLANYKFYRHESTLVEISSISVTYKVDTNRTYNLNDIIKFGYYACAESPNDNSVSASLLTVSNLYIDRYFSSSSLVINDNDGEPSGCFYIGVKCNTKDLVKLFNDFTAFSAKFKFNLSYSNASIPVTIDIIKDKEVVQKYKYYSNFYTTVVTEISKTFTINMGYNYKPSSNLVMPFVLVDDSDNMYTDINDYTIGDYFGEVNLTKSCEIGTVSGGHPTHTRMSINWNGEGTLPGWITNRNGLSTDNTTATAGFYVTSHNTKLKVSFTCNWKSSNMNYQFVIQDLSWGDAHYNFSDIFKTISITCWQDKSSTNTHVTKYTTSTLDVKNIYISSSNDYTITGINAQFKFKSPGSLPLDFITLINSNNTKIKMIFAYPTSQKPVYSNVIRANDLNTATYNINWTFSGRTSLSVKFLIE